MRLITLLILLFITTFSFAQSKKDSCYYFRKGKYVMTGPSGGDIKIKRKKKYQYERYNRERQKYKFKIEWTSACHYVLTLQKVKGKKSAKKYEGSKIYVEIINYKEDYYTAKSRTEDGTITIIEIEKTN